MAKLLRANIARLWLTKSFWVCMGFALADGLVESYWTFLEDKTALERLGGLLLSRGENIMLFAAIFTALYLGTEYSDGTLRNKLMVGRTRTEIYFSDLLSVILGSLIICAAERIGTLCIGLFTGGRLGMPADKLLFDTLIFVLALAAFCAVNTVIGTLIASRSSIVVVTFVMLFASALAASLIWSRLREPEYVPSWMFTANGVEQTESAERNPRYLDGAEREVYTFINNVLPTGQAIQLETEDIQNEAALPLYSFCVIALSSAVGAAVFSGKDIK